MHLKTATRCSGILHVTVSSGFVSRSATAQGTMPLRWHPAPKPAGPHDQTPDTRLDLLSATSTSKLSQHSLWCGGCSSCPDSQTSSPVVLLAAAPWTAICATGCADYCWSPGGNEEDDDDEEEEGGTSSRDGRSWSLGGHKLGGKKDPKLSLNSGSRPGSLPVSADAPNLSFPDGVRQEGREGPRPSLFPIKEHHGACAEPRPAPLTGESH